MIVAAAFVLASPAGTARAARVMHATLLRSTPAANSTVAAVPIQVSLVFSEEMVPDLSRIALVGATGKRVDLQVARDPYDVHTLIGTMSVADSRALCASPCRQRFTVVWRVVSADGHPVGDTLPFKVSEPVDNRSPTPSTGESATAATIPDSDAIESTVVHIAVPLDSSPVIAATLRGVGLGALMAGIGLLFFAGGDTGRTTAERWAARLILAAALVLVAHFIAWLARVSPSWFTGLMLKSALDSRVGRIEVLRSFLAVLAFWAIGLTTRRLVTVVIGSACLIVSGIAGHPAAIASAWTIPAKIAHLLAGSVWLGGLLWLLAITRDDRQSLATESRRVSRAALISVVVIFATGIVQAFFFLNRPSELVTTTYGVLLTAKIAGLLVLIALGAHNRFRLVPVMEHESTPPRLMRSVKAEIPLIVLLILIGGFLAYTPTPPRLTVGSIGPGSIR